MMTPEPSGEEPVERPDWLPKGVSLKKLQDVINSAIRKNAKDLREEIYTHILLELYREVSKNPLSFRGDNSNHISNKVYKFARKRVTWWLSHYYKDKTRRESHFETQDLSELVAGSPAPDEVISNQELRQQMLDAMPKGKLKEILGFYLDGDNGKTIASRLGVKPSTVTYYMRQIHEILRVKLSNNYES